MNNDITSKLAPFNRPHKPDDKMAAFLHRVYLLLLQAPSEMTTQAKKRSFECAADGAHSWKVVCISANALKHLAETKGTNTLQRAHALSRESRFQRMFGQTSPPMSQVELMTFFFEHDTCALVTKHENGKDTVNHWSKLYAVPEHILCKGSYSVRARACDVRWAQSLWQSV